MPKDLELEHHMTFRMDDYLYRQVAKWTLDNDISYSAFMRLCITSFLRKKGVNLADNDNPDVTREKMVFTPISDETECDDYLPDADMFGVNY